MTGQVQPSDTQTPPDGDTGAALIWTSDRLDIAAVRSLLATGKFNEAEAMLRDDTRFDPVADRTLREESLETIRRIRREYNQSEADLLAAIQKHIGDFTADDLHRLVEAGQVTCRVIDGWVCYYRREPGVMLRFCDEIKHRKAEWDAKHASSESINKPADEDRANTALNNHLAAAEKGDSPIVLPRRFQMRYTLTVKPADEQTDPTFMKPGAKLRVWLPFPQAYRQQRDVKLVIATINGKPYEPYLAPGVANADGPGLITGSPQRTAYYETTIEDPSKPVIFEQVFDYTTAGYYPVINEHNTRPLTDDERQAFAHYLAERPPHLVFTDEIVNLTRELIGDETNPYLKAKAIFDWWDANVRWMPEFEYATIPSFTKLCMQRKRGDCGVQAVTLMAMMRSAGIPARWQSGFTTAPGKENLHDWSEIYLPPHGWVVADPSFGYRKSDDPLVRNFYLGHIDAYRLVINLDYGRDLDPPKPSLRSEPADFQRGEVELDGHNLYFDDWTWGFKMLRDEPVR